MALLTRPSATLTPRSGDEIMKMRESRYDTSIREFQITDRGLDVAASFESAEAILTGHARMSAVGPSDREVPA